MTQRSRRILHEVHRLACLYHWSEPVILSLPITRRLAYLRILQAEEDSALFPDLEER
jgi:hypothetical protein